LNHLKEKTLKQRLTTIREKQSSTKSIKAQRLTTKQTTWQKHKKESKDIQKTTMISKRKEVQGRAEIFNGRRSYVEQTSHQRYHEATRPRFQEI